MPKLRQFYEAHPGVSVILDENLQLVTFKNDGFDGAIRYADGNFENLNSDHLITIKIHAVASPAYIEKYGRPESIENAVGHYLIDNYPDREGKRPIRDAQI